MADALLWFDIETTGLNPHEDHVLEAAWQLTTMRGDLLPYSNHMYVDGDASLCNDFVRDMHTRNGLLADRADYALGHGGEVDTWQGVVATLNGHAQHAKDRDGFDQIHLAGASVHFDRSFATAKGYELPALSHRHVDVSTLKLAAAAVGRRYNKSVVPRHRAWWDVVEEIDAYKALLKIVAK